MLGSLVAPRCAWLLCAAVLLDVYAPCPDDQDTSVVAVAWEGAALVSAVLQLDVVIVVGPETTIGSISSGYMATLPWHFFPTGRGCLNEHFLQYASMAFVNGLYLAKEHDTEKITHIKSLNTFRESLIESESS